MRYQIRFSGYHGDSRTKSVESEIEVDECLNEFLAAPFWKKITITKLKETT